MWARKATASSLRCSFCHKPKEQVEQLLSPGHARSSERSSQFFLAPKRCIIVCPLPRSQTEPGSKDLRDAKQLDRHPSSRRGTRIASQPLCPREPIVGTLGTGKRRRRESSEVGRSGRFDLDLDPLMTHQLDARPSVEPAPPVTPEKRLRTHDKRVQQDAHLARLLGSAAMPLTLVAQGTRTATADAGCIHHAQASIGFSAPLMDNQRLASRTAQRPIWLGEKVLS